MRDLALIFIAGYFMRLYFDSKIVTVIMFLFVGVYIFCALGEWAEDRREQREIKKKITEKMINALDEKFDNEFTKELERRGDL